MSPGVGSTSAGTVVARSAARSGFIPIPLTETPAEVLHEVAVYLKGAPGGASSAGGFALYRNTGTRFSEEDRRRLLASRVQFVYVRTADHHRFRTNLVGRLERVVLDEKLPLPARARVVYQTSLELINELLGDPEVPQFSAQLDMVTRSVSTLVLNNRAAFAHLLATAQHDFYTATHMVNVATWMVALAHALGCEDTRELARICEAGLLHDLGKTCVPDAILNKQGELTEAEWAIIKRHPVEGAARLARYEGIDPLVVTVARQHHERQDGSGYPDGLRGADIHPASRICAVADAFDAMTSLRPFKERALTLAEALGELERRSPAQYDSDVLAAWRRLLGTAAPGIALPEVDRSEEPAEGGRERRAYPRFPFECPGHVEFVASDTGAREAEEIPIVTRNLSRCGLGILCQVPLPVGERLRVYLRARLWNREFLVAETVRCRAYGEGWYEIGMRFVREDA